MKLTHKVFAVGAVMIGLLGSGATATTAAAATTPTPPPGPSASPSPRSVADIKHHINMHLTKVIGQATAARKRVAADPNLTAAQKARLDTDLSKLIADATTARREVNAATDRAGLQAARPALEAVKADRHQLHKDWQAIHPHGTPLPTETSSEVPTAPSTS
jgi:hypothetical protein